MSFQLASGVFVAQKLQLAFASRWSQKKFQKMMEGERRKCGGRPKQNIKRESATGVRFTKAEYLIIKQKASIAGMRITTYIREMALHGKIIARRLYLLIGQMVIRICILYL